MKNLDLLLPQEMPDGGTWSWATIYTGFNSEKDFYANIRVDGEEVGDGIEGPNNSAIVWMCDPMEFATYDGRSNRTMAYIADGRIHVFSNGRGLPVVDGAQIEDPLYPVPNASGKTVFTPSGGPSLRVGTGSDWWAFTPAEGGSTTWRTTLTDYYVNGSPPIGMTFYNTDTDSLDTWDGTEWKSLKTAIGDTRGMIGTTGTSGSGWSRITPLADDTEYPTIGASIGTNGASFVANVTGTYLCQGTIQMASGAGARIGIGFDAANVYNDPWLDRNNAGLVPAPSSTGYVNGSIPLHVEAGQLIRMWGFSDSSTTKGAGTRTWFRVTRLN